MSWVTLSGGAALTFMMVMYWLKHRGAVLILDFALGCLLSSVYGFLAGAWPFGVPEAVWRLIAVRRYAARRPGRGEVPAQGLLVAARSASRRRALGRAGPGRQVGGLAAGFQAPTVALQGRAEQRRRLLEFGDPTLQLLDLPARQRLPRTAAVEESSDLIQGEARSLTERDRAHSSDHLRVIAALSPAATGRRDQADPVVVSKRGGGHTGVSSELSDG
jgi:hypothetical protein